MCYDDGTASQEPRATPKFDAIMEEKRIDQGNKCSTTMCEPTNKALLQSDGVRFALEPNSAGVAVTLVCSFKGMCRDGATNKTRP